MIFLLDGVATSFTNQMVPVSVVIEMLRVHVVEVSKKNKHVFLAEIPTTNSVSTTDDEAITSSPNLPKHPRVFRSRKFSLPSIFLPSSSSSSSNITTAVVPSSPHILRSRSPPPTSILHLSLDHVRYSRGERVEDEEESDDDDENNNNKSKKKKHRSRRKTFCSRSSKHDFSWECLEHPEFLQLRLENQRLKMELNAESQRCTILRKQIETLQSPSLSLPPDPGGDSKTSPSSRSSCNFTTDL
eukprot:TRINITY_DN1469_c0_g1_i2.p2 TRINITY_DN1469_c0_g1~~TRINITY_DN1469_c0_g1_i2.p2  ORF type:complete len:243 (+),score=55.91 TRINITY_DN1469_c0_g1_i2:1007-1735(+)